MWQATDTMDTQNYLIKDLEKFFQLLAKTQYLCEVSNIPSSLQRWVHIEQKEKAGQRAAGGQREAEAKKVETPQASFSRWRTLTPGNVKVMPSPGASVSFLIF